MQLSLIVGSEQLIMSDIPVLQVLFLCQQNPFTDNFCIEGNTSFVTVGQLLALDDDLR